MSYAPKFIDIENTRFIFRTNFSGDPSRDKYGNPARQCNIVLPSKDVADDMSEMGLNVRMQPGRDETEEDTYFIRAIAGYHDEPEKQNMNPDIYLVSGDSDPVLLDVNTVGRLDRVYVKNVNVRLRPNFSKKYNKWSVYIDKMYVEQDVDSDPFASRYSRAVINDDEEIPFG